MTGSHNIVRDPRRAGWTLIEILIVCTTVGILTVTGAVTISMLMSAESRGAESLVRQTTLARLGDRFRADVHATAHATLEEVEGRRMLVLEQPDGSTIRYEITEDAIERRAGEVVAGGHRERFRLRGTPMLFESANDGRIIRLVLTPPGELISETAAGDVPPPVSQRITIEAAMAWDLRHSGPEQRNSDSGE